MNLLQTVLAFVVALGVLIVVHEYGHYLAARLCNVRVLRFSVGFGRSLASARPARLMALASLAAAIVGLAASARSIAACSVRELAGAI